MHGVSVTVQIGSSVKFVSKAQFTSNKLGSNVSDDKLNQRLEIALVN